MRNINPSTGIERDSKWRSAYRSRHSARHSQTVNSVCKFWPNTFSTNQNKHLPLDKNRRDSESDHSWIDFQYNNFRDLLKKNKIAMRCRRHRCPSLDRLARFNLGLHENKVSPVEQIDKRHCQNSQVEIRLKYQFIIKLWSFSYYIHCVVMFQKKRQFSIHIIINREN